MAKLTVDRISRQIAMSYSNMPTSKEHWNYIGSKCKSISAFLPGVGDMLGGFIAISHGNALRISLITDLHYIKYPDEFIDSFKSLSTLQKGKVLFSSDIMLLMNYLYLRFKITLGAFKSILTT